MSQTAAGAAANRYLQIDFRHERNENDLELGELCWRIQSMILKKILPPSLYSETFPYNLYFINHEILRLPFDMRDKAEKA